jgi:hypothetical protein
MNARIRIFAAALLAALALSACDTLEGSDFVQERVVEGYLIVDEPLGQIRLTRTEEIGETYDATALAITGATVSLDLLAPDGSVERTFAYEHDPQVLGVYRAVDANELVQPLRRYRLRVDVPEEEPITGETLVPGRFEVLGTNASCVLYQGTEQFGVDVTRSDYPGRQAYYLFSTEVIGEINRDRLTPIADALLDEDEDLEDSRRTVSPPLNEANFNPDFSDEFTIELPWLAIAFYGQLSTSAQAVDDNLYDFVRSANVQQGGSTLSPGQIPNLLVNLEGAQGIFGSLASSRLDIYIARESLDECPG